MNKNTTYEEDIETFSGFTQMELSLTSPMEIDIEKMEFKSLTLMTGINDSGKSLVNKLNWCSTMFFNMQLIYLSTPEVEKEMGDVELLQFILDTSFVDQDFDGDVEFSYVDPLMSVKFYKIRYALKAGKVENLFFDTPSNTTPMGEITYLSSNVRDFEVIERYNSMKKMLNITELTTFESIKPLTQMFRLYDIFALETLTSKMPQVANLMTLMGQVGANKLLEEEFNIKSISYDDTKGRLYATTIQDELKPISSMGKGLQAIIVMMMVNS